MTIWYWYGKPITRIHSHFNWIRKEREGEKHEDRKRPWQHLFFEFWFVDYIILPSDPLNYFHFPADWYKGFFPSGPEICREGKIEIKQYNKSNLIIWYCLCYFCLNQQEERKKNQQKYVFYNTWTWIVSIISTWKSVWSCFNTLIGRGGRSKSYFKFVVVALLLHNKSVL